MTRSPSRGMLHVLARLFAGAPFLLAFIRVATTQNRDTRLLWLAVASLAGAGIAIVTLKSRRRDRQTVVSSSIIVGASAAVAAVIAAWLLWSMFSVGASMFAIVFGIGWGMSYALDTLSRRAEP
jgi:hypothetical protein